MENIVRKAFVDSIETKQRVIERIIPDITQAAELIISALKDGNKVLACGNGGSAADAQHFIAELIVRFETERESLPGVALTTDTSILTAGSNDYGYEHVFERQVEGLGEEGDILVGISTSGNSDNVLRALKVAQEKGMTCIGLTGKDGGDMNDMELDACIVVPSDNTARVQESHETIYHSWCKLVDKAFDDA